MIFIGLDVSKNSTALCIEKNNIVDLYSYTSSKANNIWVKKTNKYINFNHIKYDYSDEKDYSKSELLKLNEFDDITDLILNDILENLDILDSIKIGIEGYSYNSKGPIFDLIEFTTLLKYKLIHKLNKYAEITIISPLTLKSSTCKMVYKPRIEVKGKRVIKHIEHYESPKGKEATKFDKWDMFYAFLDSSINMEVKEWLKENLADIEANSKVFKPMDDIIDSCFLKEIMKKQYYQK